MKMPDGQFDDYVYLGKMRGCLLFVHLVLLAAGATVNVNLLT